MKNRRAFIRVDDVWELSRDFALLLEVAKRHDTLLSVGIVPMKTTKKFARQLSGMKKEGLICIHQHGVYHRRRKKGEFGTAGDEQLIKLGSQKMYGFFREYPKVISLPWQYYTPKTLKLFAKYSYEVISAHFDQRFLAHFFYFVGKKLKRQFLFGRRISYHGEIIPRTNIKELSTSIDLLRSYNPYEWKKSQEVIDELKNFKNEDLGLLIHPSEINGSLEEIGRIFEYLKNNYELHGLS